MKKTKSVNRLAPGQTLLSRITTIMFRKHTASDENEGIGLQCAQRKPPLNATRHPFPIEVCT